MSKSISNRWLDVEDDGELAVLRLRVDKLPIDDVTREVFEQIDSVLTASDRLCAILDMKSVTYAASMALGKLVKLNRGLLDRGGWLALIQLSPQFQEVVEVSRLSTLFEVFETEQQAREAFAKRANG